MSPARGLSNLRARYFRWAQKYYDRFPEGMRDEARRFDERFYSWRGIVGVLVLLALAGVLAGALSVASGKSFVGLLWPMVVLVFASAFLLFVAWFGFWSVKGKPSRFALRFGAGLLVGGITGYVTARLVMGRADQPLFSESFVRTLPMAFTVVLIGTAVIGLVVVLRSREYAERVRAAQLDAERERTARLASEAELRALHAQIEPHFLFNTLSSAQYLAAAGDPRAATLLEQLNKFLRGTLAATRKRSVSLNEEIELVRSYTAIAKLRLGERLSVAIDIAEVPPVDLPPAALLTLVENAIEHAIEPAVQGGEVVINAEADSRAVHISVSNSGQPLASPLQEGVGLSNLRQRLALLHGDGAQLQLTTGADGRTAAALLIPLSP